MTAIDDFADLSKRLGGRFLVEDAPSDEIPEDAMSPVDAMRLIEEDLVLDGIPERNLATFVTTWMSPEAEKIISENLHRNFIDHAEYPQTAEIEQRCIRMLAGEEQLPVVAFHLATEGNYDEFDIAWQLAAERGWMLPAYTMPPNAQEVKMLRALVKMNLSHALVTTLADDIASACETLEKKGGAHASERAQVKTSTAY